MKFNYRQLSAAVWLATKFWLIILSLAIWSHLTGFGFSQNGTLLLQFCFPVICK